MYGEPANLAPLTDEELQAYYEKEAAQMQRWWEMYQQEPCSRNYKFYTVHRDICHELALEIDRREEPELQPYPIEEVLGFGGVQFEMINGRAYIA